MLLKDSYANKTLCLTGATGFLGKVVLERVLWEFPDVTLVRVFLRGSKKQNAATRLAELWPLELFDRLRARHGGAEAFERWAATKTVACEANMDYDRLGMTPAAYDEATAGLDIVIHCAALVSWDERLDRRLARES